jgi:signal recognition particle GTPase
MSAGLIGGPSGDSDLTKAIKEKIKGIMFDVYPEEKWDALITQTIQEFVGKELRAIVAEELKSRLKELVKTRMQSYSSWVTLEDGRSVEKIVDEELINTFKNNADEIFSAMVRSIFSEFVQRMRQNSY